MLDFVAPNIFTIFGYMEIKKYIGEIWKPVRGYDGLYEVSNYGRVRNARTKRILKQQLDGKGYLRVGLCKNGIMKTHKVHRLVAETFIPNPNNLPQVNHKNEDKTDNFVWVNPDGTVDLEKSNLEWCTRKYNLNYGNYKEIQREIHLNEGGEPVVQFSKTGELINDKWESMSEVERVLGINHTNISKCCQGKIKSIGGFVWKYKRDVV